jgi:hypothetical protein
MRGLLALDRNWKHSVNGLLSGAKISPRSVDEALLAAKRSADTVSTCRLVSTELRRSRTLRAALLKHAHSVIIGTSR